MLRAVSCGVLLRHFAFWMLLVAVRYPVAARCVLLFALEPAGAPCNVDLAASAVEKGERCLARADEVGMLAPGAYTVPSDRPKNGRV